MTDMREAVAKAKLRWNWPSLADTDIEEMLPDHIGEATAIFDAIMPEIDRRVAEERAKLLERLRVTQEALAITRSALIHRAYCAS